MRTRCTLPRWLLALLGAALVPWLVWATHTLMRHDIQQELTNQRLQHLETGP